MLIASLVVALTLGQLPAAAPAPELAVLKAGLGMCSADFTVKLEDGTPVYGATVHVRVRYGALSVKRADLEVGTNSNGQARIEGLPAKGKALAFDIQKDGKRGTAAQILSQTCEARHEVTLK